MDKYESLEGLRNEEDNYSAFVRIIFLEFGSRGISDCSNSRKKATVTKSVKTTANIAFVIDGPSPANDYFLEKFKKSITQSVSQDYNAVYPKELTYTADWTEAGVKKICDKALASNANIIIALGYLTSKYISKVNNNGKFVVTVDQYGLRDFGDEFFSPVSQMCQKVEQFKRLTDFNKVAILMNEGYYKTQKDWNKVLERKFEGKNINFMVVPVNGNVDRAIEKYRLMLMQLLFCLSLHLLLKIYRICSLSLQTEEL